MDSLITNGIDPSLLRVIEKRGHERESERRPRRGPAAQAPEKAGALEEEDESKPASEPEKHEFDDLA